MTGLTRDMVLDRTRLLAGITRRQMSAVASVVASWGMPHQRSETAAAYVEAAALLNDEFDTTGMEESFCSDCGHDPCVAEYRRFPIPGTCTRTPRDLSVGRVTYPITSAGAALTGQTAQVYAAMSPMVHLLDSIATINDSGTAHLSLKYLVKVRDEMRRVVAS